MVKVNIINDDLQTQPPSGMLGLLPSNLKPGVIKLDYDMDWHGLGDEFQKYTFASRPSRDGKAETVHGLPATARMVVGGSEYRDMEIVDFTESLQRWMFELCREYSPGQSLNDAKSNFSGAFWDGRALCDFAGSKTRADYINGKNLDAGPIALKPLSFSGCYFGYYEIINVPGNGLCWKIAAINVNKIPSNLNDALIYLRQYHPSTHPHYFFRPTNSRRVPVMDPSGRYRIDWIEWVSEPWHWFDYKMVMPLLSNRDYVFLPLKRCYELTADHIPTPYVQYFDVDPEKSTPFYPSPYS